MDGKLEKETIEKTQSETVEELDTREPEQVSEEQMVGSQSTPAKVEPVVEEQSTEPNISEISIETTTGQRPLEFGSEAPSSSHSNMSYADFARFQTQKTDFFKNIFRDINKASKKQ